MTLRNFGERTLTLSIGKAWEETSAFLAREGRLVAPVALAMFALPSILLNWAYPAGAAGAAGGGAMLALFVILVAVMIGQMTVILLAIGWHGSIGEAIRKVAKRVPSLLGAALIVFAPILMLFMIGFAAALIAAGIKDPTGLTPQALARIPNIGWMSLLLMLVVLFVGVRLFPLSAVAAAEPVGPIGLLKRSWALTKRHFGRLLALLLLLAMAALILNAAVAAVVGSVTSLALGEARPFNLAALSVALAGGIVSALVSSVSAAMVGRVYVQLAGASKA